MIIGVNVIKKIETPNSQVFRFKKLRSQQQQQRPALFKIDFFVNGPDFTN